MVATVIFGSTSSYLIMVYTIVILCNINVVTSDNIGDIFYLDK